MKTTMVVALAAVMCTGMTYAKGHHGGGFGGPRPMMGGRGGFRPAPVHHHRHHRHTSHLFRFACAEVGLFPLYFFVDSLKGCNFASTKNV